MPAHPPPPLRPALPSLESVTTIRPDGSRPFLYPADSRGRFTTARRLSAWVLIVVYLSLPWIPIGGYPAVFLDVATRRFHLFGLTLAAQDVWLLFFLITGAGFSLFLLTALLGRVWCGWACPQTVFLDQIYRPIERWIDGDALARRKLAAAPLSLLKLGRRILKHAAYLAVSAVIAHLFLAYFVSIPTVWSMMRSAPVAHWSAFAFITIFAGTLYFNFAWFREQLCIVICPYGRMQSVLIDDHTMVIGYDYARGEPRSRPHPARSGPLVASAAIAATPVAANGNRTGDCVDCLRCVHVCPTGIDIRQGLQLECIGCTACIDACDDVMTRLHRPRGLIRYASQNAFAGRPTRWFRPRIALYGVLMLVGAGMATWALSTFRPANLGVTRITGAPYIVDTASVRNQFFVRIVNKRNAAARFTVGLERAAAGTQQVGLTSLIEVPALGELVQPLVVQQARKDYAGPFVFAVRVRDETGTLTLRRDVEFLGPEARLLREEEEEQRERHPSRHHDSDDHD